MHDAPSSDHGDVPAVALLGRIAGWERLSTRRVRRSRVRLVAIHGRVPVRSGAGLRPTSRTLVSAAAGSSADPRVQLMSSCNLILGRRKCFLDRPRLLPPIQSDEGRCYDMFALLPLLFLLLSIITPEMDRAGMFSEIEAGAANAARDCRT